VYTEAAVAQYEVMSRYVPGAEENQENLNPDSLTKDQDFDPKPTVYEKEW
jgi:hypothetical protein